MYSYAIDIAAAPDAVFDELSHVERHPRGRTRRPR